MEIKVSVEDIDLASKIGGYDENDDQRTLASLVAYEIVRQMRQDKTSWVGFAKHYEQVRDEMVRETVAAQIGDVLANPIHRTNQYGERTGDPVTMRELILAEARDYFTQKRRNDRDSYNAPQFTDAQRAISAAIHGELDKQITAMVAEERDKITATVRGRVAAILAKAVPTG